jgi:hypothetical protein
VEITDKKGKKFWCNASALMTKREAQVKLLDYMINNLCSIAIGDLDLSKAELKRRMVSAGLISK